MSPLVALFAPTLWGRLADRSGARVRVLAVAIGGAALATAAISLLEGYWPLLAGSVVLAVFSTGVIPLLVSVTLAALGEDALRRFGYVRVWGTLGFLVVVVGFPPSLHRFQAARGLAPVPGSTSEPGLSVMFLVAAVWMIASMIVALRVAEPGAASARAPSRDWLVLRTHRPFVGILLVSFGAFLCIQGPMSMFPIYLRAHGGGLDALSNMWIFMLALEIPLVAFSGPGLRRIGPRGLVAMGLAAGGIRWLVCGQTSHLPTIYAVQLLHGVTVAGVGVGASLYVESSVPASLRSTGQGLAAMAGVGAGAILSNVAAGWMIDHLGTDAPFLAGGAGTLALALLVPLLLPEPVRPRPEGMVREDGG
jgi:PPP family 3-phenylpropionic acid transporter